MKNLILDIVKQFEKPMLQPAQIGERQLYAISSFTSTTHINRKAANFFRVNEVYSKAERGNEKESEDVRRMNKVKSVTFKKGMKFFIFPFFIAFVLIVEGFRAILKFVEDTDVTSSEVENLQSENYYNEKNDNT